MKTVGAPLGTAWNVLGADDAALAAWEAIAVNATAMVARNKRCLMFADTAGKHVQNGRAIRMYGTLRGRYRFRIHATQ